MPAQMINGPLYMLLGRREEKRNRRNLGQSRRFAYTAADAATYESRITLRTNTITLGLIERSIAVDYVSSSWHASAFGSAGVLPTSD
jgi:hypothetical protein